MVTTLQWLLGHLKRTPKAHREATFPIFAKADAASHLAVADVMALRAIPLEDLAGGMNCPVLAGPAGTLIGVGYDPASTDADDNSTVFQPNAVSGGDPGRWILMSGASGGGTDVEWYANRAGLKAVTTMIEGRVYGVGIDANYEVSLYAWNPTSIDVADDDLYLLPSNLTVYDPGRFVRIAINGQSERAYVYAGETIAPGDVVMWENIHSIYGDSISQISGWNITCSDHLHKQCKWQIVTYAGLHYVELLDYYSHAILSQGQIVGGVAHVTSVFGNYSLIGIFFVAYSADNTDIANNNLVWGRDGYVNKCDSGSPVAGVALSGGASYSRISIVTRGPVYANLGGVLPTPYLPHAVGSLMGVYDTPTTGVIGPIAAGALHAVAGYGMESVLVPGATQMRIFVNQGGGLYTPPAP